MIVISSYDPAVSRAPNPATLECYAA